MSPASAKGISMDAAAAAACRTGWHVAHFTLTQGGSESFSQWKICLWYEFDWTQAQVASGYGCLLISFAYSRLVVNLIFLSWTLSCYLYKRTRKGRAGASTLTAFSSYYRRFSAHANVLRVTDMCQVVPCVGGAMCNKIFSQRPTHTRFHPTAPMMAHCL